MIKERCIEAYGGEDFWRSLKKIEAVVSANGLAFSLKRRPFFNKAKIVMEVGQPISELTPIGKNPEITGRLNGFDVQLTDGKKHVLEERKDAHTYFPLGRRLFKWDDLDMSYFANYAFWNYFTFPRLLMNETIEWEEKENGRLYAKFPESLPTHSRKQEFRFNPETGLLQQHNYTANVISRFANAAHVVHQHKTFEGISVPISRIVTPQGRRGNPLSKPILINIDVHDVKFYH